MRPALVPALAFGLALSGGGCVLVWHYDAFKDQPAHGTGGASGTGGGQGTGGKGTGGAPKLADGQPCAEATACLSGACQPSADAGSVCCAAVCAVCQVCGATGAACGPVATGVSGPGCAAPLVCNPAGVCVTPNGGACDGGGCLSGNCVGTVCCASACPECQACDPTGATCVAVPDDTPCAGGTGLCSSGQCN